MGGGRKGLVQCLNNTISGLHLKAEGREAEQLQEQPWGSENTGRHGREAILGLTGPRHTKEVLVGRGFPRFRLGTRTSLGEKSQ